MWDKKKVNLSDVIADLKAGLGDVPVMEKYGLSPDLLLRILERLRKEENHAALTERTAPAAAETEGEDRHDYDKASRDLETTPPSEAERKAEAANRRSEPRNYLLYDVPIFDAIRPEIKGYVNDVSDEGLQIRGIKAQVGEMRRFMILDSRVFKGEGSLFFDALCRWVTNEGEGETLAGFCITNISEGSRRELRRLVEWLAVTEP